MSVTVTYTKSLILVTIAATLVALPLPGCGRSMTSRHPGCCSAPTVTSTLPVPPTWQTGTYGQVAISVPGDWVVRHDTNCPDGQAPGTLLLGFPKVLQSCPEFSNDYVAVITLAGGALEKPPSGSGMPRSINGLLIYPESQTPGWFDWALPSLGIEVNGNPGQDADQILETIRRS
jgi:hypothetical protein